MWWILLNRIPLPSQKPHGELNPKPNQGLLGNQGCVNWLPHSDSDLTEITYSRFFRCYRELSPRHHLYHLLHPSALLLWPLARRKTWAVPKNSNRPFVRWQSKLLIFPPNNILPTLMGSALASPLSRASTGECGAGLNFVWPSSLARGRTLQHKVKLVVVSLKIERKVRSDVRMEQKICSPSRKGIITVLHGNPTRSVDPLRRSCFFSPVLLCLFTLYTWLFWHLWFQFLVFQYLIPSPVFLLVCTISQASHFSPKDQKKHSSFSSSRTTAHQNCSFSVIIWVISAHLYLAPLYCINLKWSLHLFILPPLSTTGSTPNNVTYIVHLELPMIHPKILPIGSLSIISMKAKDWVWEATASVGKIVISTKPC